MNKLSLTALVLTIVACSKSPNPSDEVERVMQAITEHSDTCRLNAINFAKAKSAKDFDGVTPEFLLSVPEAKNAAGEPFFLNWLMGIGTRLSYLATEPAAKVQLTLSKEECRLYLQVIDSFISGTGSENGEVRNFCLGMLPECVKPQIAGNTPQALRDDWKKHPLKRAAEDVIKQN